MCARQLKAITLFAGGGLYHLHFAAAWPMRSYRVLLYNGHSFLPCRICMAGKLCYTKVYLKTKAIPHNSKCRYGEQGAAAAKPKAQIILDVLSSILATQMPCRSRWSGAYAVRRELCGIAQRKWRIFRKHKQDLRLFNAKSGCVCRNRLNF